MLKKFGLDRPLRRIPSKTAKLLRMRDFYHLLGAGHLTPFDAEVPSVPPTIYNLSSGPLS